MDRFRALALVAPFFTLVGDGLTDSTGEELELDEDELELVEEGDEELEGLGEEELVELCLCTTARVTDFLSMSPGSLSAEL